MNIARRRPYHIDVEVFEYTNDTKGTSTMRTLFHIYIETFDVSRVEILSIRNILSKRYETELDKTKSVSYWILLFSTRYEKIIKRTSTRI